MVKRVSTVTVLPATSTLRRPMIEFRTLGTVDLRDGTGERIISVLQHSKSLSLLAYFCASCPVRLHRRDTLVALLWPELDDVHARGALRSELSQLRRALGPHVLRGDRAQAVGVDGERIWCDATAFEAALDAGRLAEGLELLRGEFLPGLHVPDSAFDGWLAGTRDRLTRRAIDAAGRLRAAAEERSDWKGALRWSRRCTELAPYDETELHRLLSTLDRLGDRAGALAAYNTFATRLRLDLDVEVSPETRALADGIRERTLTADAGGTSSESRPVGVGLQAGRVPESAPVDPVPPDPVRIAVRPVENLTGDPRHEILSRRLTDRLIGGIAELAYVEVVPGRETLGTTATVSTTLYPGSDEVEARTRVSESAEGGRVLAMPEPALLRAHPTDEELDRVVARVLASVAVHYDPRQPIAFVGGHPARTPSWQAFLEYIQGADAFGALKFEQAAARLRRAYELDPSFLKAALFAAVALAYAGDPVGADKLATEAMAAVEFPSEYERWFGEWFLASLHGRRAEAYRAAMETIRLTSHPVLVSIAAWEAANMNRPAECVRLVGGGVLREMRGWWRNWPEGLDRVPGSLHVLGNHPEELAAALAAREHRPEALEAIRGEVRARAALGEPEIALQLVDQALTLPPGLVSPAEVAWTAAQELETHGNADAAAAARQAGLAWLARRARPARADVLLEVRLLLEAGDAEQAGQHLCALAPFQELDALGLAGLLSATVGDATAACQAIAELEAIQFPYLSGRHLLWATGIRATLGQPDLAMDTLRRALAAGLPFSVELHALPMLRPLAARADFTALLRPRG